VAKQRHIQLPVHLPQADTDYDLQWYSHDTIQRTKHSGLTEQVVWHTMHCDERTSEYQVTSDTAWQRTTVFYCNANSQLVTDHPRSGVIYNFSHVGSAVWNMITFESLDIGRFFHTLGMSWGNKGQVRIWRSSGQGQDHRSKEHRKSLFLKCLSIPLPAYGISLNTRICGWSAFRMYQCNVGLIMKLCQVLLQ